MAMGKPDPMQFVDASDVDLLGVMNTVAVSIPHLATGSSIIVTGSTAGMIRGTTTSPDMGPGGSGYGWSKRIVMEYVEEMSLALAPQMIRVNAIHPTNCNTHLLQNDGMYNFFLPGPYRRGKEAHPRRRRPLFTLFQAMPIPYVEPEDMANLGVFLARDEVVTSPGNRSALMVAHFSSGPMVPAGRFTHRLGLFGLRRKGLVASTMRKSLASQLFSALSQFLVELHQHRRSLLRFPAVGIRIPLPRCRTRQR